MRVAFFMFILSWAVIVDGVASYYGWNQPKKPCLEWVEFKNIWSSGYYCKERSD